MLAAKTELKNAEKLKRLLLENNLINTNYKSKIVEGSIFFPVKEKPEEISNDKENSFFEIVEIKLDEKEKTPTLKDFLKDKLNQEEMKLIPKTQEVIGDILILEIPEEIESKEKVIAEAYLNLHKQIRTVVKKTDIHSGTFRTRKVKVLAGENKKETIHLENGIRLKLNIERTYFSARLANERLRITRLVKPNEEILVMFSGSGPYPLVLAKNSPVKEILGIEINPDAHSFATKNIELNKINKKNKVIELINGDVRKILPNINKKFDRILMPLPKTSEEFLDVALPKVKEKGMIHLYAFLNEKDINQEEKKIINLCKALGYKVRVVNIVKCGQHAPYTFRVCFDLICEKE